jgi:hypothetical protein
VRAPAAPAPRARASAASSLNFCTGHHCQQCGLPIVPTHLPTIEPAVERPHANGSSIPMAMIPVLESVKTD